MSATWYCCRQRAGPLVKECRALRPRFGADDTAQDRAEKNAVKKYQRTAVSRKMVDRLELRIALFGRNGWMHTLTFDSDHLPRDFKGVRAALKTFFQRVRRWREKLGKPPSFCYIYAIEGLHGNRRYHIHFISDYYELGPAEVQHLWRCGMVDSEPVLLKDGGFRRLAEYLNKERTDGFVIPIGRHPWSCSRTLNAKLPPPEKWTDESGVIEVPDDAVWSKRGNIQNDFGAYYYANWIMPESRATD